MHDLHARLIWRDWHDDQALGALPIPDGDNHCGEWLILSWYKQRGRTDAALTFPAHSHLTLQMADWIIANVPENKDLK